jgi:hypothetical protein
MADLGDGRIPRENFLALSCAAMDNRESWRVSQDLDRPRPMEMVKTVRGTPGSTTCTYMYMDTWPLMEMHD